MADLRKFRDKLGTLRLFDPACGCGNFLTIAYRELRTLEIDVLREIASRATATQLALAVQSVVDVDQFYGIEIGEFPARIAATALWMMDHIMNNRLSLEFGQTYARIPIEKSPHIRNADALEIDSADVLPPDECSYVFGNPPFGGSKFQSPEQRAQVRRVAAQALEHDPNLLFGCKPPARLPPDFLHDSFWRRFLAHGAPPPLARKCLLLSGPQWSKRV